MGSSIMGDSVFFLTDFFSKSQNNYILLFQKNPFILRIRELTQNANTPTKPTTVLLWPRLPRKQGTRLMDLPSRETGN